MNLPSLCRARLSSLLHKSIRLESIQKANLEVEATHGPLKHSVDLGAANPGTGVKPDIGVATPHHRSNSMRGAACKGAR